jgi:hypothetical protein
MLKETTAGSSQGGLVYLRYTFWYRSQFDEPNDDWLEAVEATSDELLGAYTKAEDEAMIIAFTLEEKRCWSRHPTRYALFTLHNDVVNVLDTSENNPASSGMKRNRSDGETSSKL